MTDAYAYPSDDDSDAGASPPSPWAGVNLLNPGYGDDPYQGGLPQSPSQVSCDPLAHRLGLAMQSIVADPYGLNDSDPATDPLVRQLRGPPPAPPAPGLLNLPSSDADPSSSNDFQPTGFQPAFGYGGASGAPNGGGLDYGLATDGDGQLIDIGGRSATLRRQ